MYFIFSFSCGFHPLAAKSGRLGNSRVVLLVLILAILAFVAILAIPAESQPIQSGQPVAGPA
jgi:ABC-type transport system involved in cytochrome c biogenesis permease subunit